jgi:hypothetical protein
VIALFWLAHHRLFRVVRRYDDGVLLLDLLVLFCIAFLLYPGAILGDRGLPGLDPGGARSPSDAGAEALVAELHRAGAWFALDATANGAPS